MSVFGYLLGIDFGTSHTVAMLRWPDGRVKPLLFDGTPLLPSAVYAPPDGAALLAGVDALHHGRHTPASLEPNPKRRVDDGSVLLGSREVSTQSLVTAVLSRVGNEAARVAGGQPSALVLSHPASWGPVRRLLLADAAGTAGLPAPTFVAEPVAAARYFTTAPDNPVEAGSTLLVYDLGAGTFDVSIVRTGADPQVLASDGLTEIGGLDIDAAIVDWLRPRYPDEAWRRLHSPATTEDHRHRMNLWSEARVGKEMLSRTAAVQLRPPLLTDEILLSLEDFERVARPLIDRTVRTAVALNRYCGTPATHILLVGGSSRIPLVATALHRAFGIPPTVTEQPELVVAEGCVAVPRPVRSRPPLVATTGVVIGEVGPSIPQPAPHPPGQAEPQPQPHLPAQSAGRPEQPTHPPMRPGQRPPPQLPAQRPRGTMYGQTPEQRPPRTVVTRPPVPSPDRPGPPSEFAAPPPAPDDQRVPATRPTPRRPQPVQSSPSQPSPGVRARSAAATVQPTNPGRTNALVALGTLALVAVLVAIVIASGAWPIPTGNRADPTAHTDTAGARSDIPPGFPEWPVKYADSLDEKRSWIPTAQPNHNAECAFRTARLEVIKTTGGVFRCPGRRDELADFTLSIEVFLLENLPCAGLWLRFGAHENGQESGYLLKVCNDALVLGLHHATGTVEEIRRFPTAQIATGDPVVIRVVAKGDQITFFRGSSMLGEERNGAYPRGRIALGIAVDQNTGGRVGFRGIEVRTPPEG